MDQEKKVWPVLTCSKSKKETTNKRSGQFFVNFEQITHCSGISIVDFEQKNVCWDITKITEREI